MTLPAASMRGEECQFSRSAALIAGISDILPGGVSSNFRLGMAPHPLVFERGEGAYLLDVDGNRMIDYYGGMGAMLLGHNPAAVRQAVHEQVERGILYAGQSLIEFEAATLLHQRVPCAQKLRFCSSGSEAAQAAIRLARAATGRNLIVKFEGHYHGWFDNLLWSTAPPIDPDNGSSRPRITAGSDGQDMALAAGVDVLAWNDLAILKERLEAGDVAGVLMEPAMCNQGGISPRSGYLQGALELCHQHGAVLIFDEVITGFRLGAGGAQEYFGVTPDLAIFAKGMANGFPVAAIAGRADLLDMFTDGVLHGGTFNAQPIGMAATVATQRALTPEKYDAATSIGLRLQDGIRRAMTDAGLPVRVTGFPLVFHVALGATSDPHDYRSLQFDRPGYRHFVTRLLHRGIRVLERGTWFVSSAHSDAEIDLTLEAVRLTAREFAAGRA